MNRIVNRRTYTLSAVLLATGALVALTTPAHASIYNDGAPCYGASCVGKSPNIQNSLGYSCVSGEPGQNNGAVDLETVQSPDTYHGQTGYNQVTLRWSSYCGANWARWSGTEPLDKAHFWAQSYDLKTQPPAGAPFTYMVDGTQLAQACVEDYGDGSYSCTGWH